jgi:RHS repeat-associated protein
VSFIFNDLLPVIAITPRGFTGHEHVDHANVIHMNGRIYDPAIGRFMQADPMVQEVDNSQNFNRYSYVINNPLSYTDPTGYFFENDYADSVERWAEGKQNEYANQINNTEQFKGKNTDGTLKGSTNDGSDSSGTNVENSDISGSRVGGKKPEGVDVNFKIDKIKGHDDGWEDPHEAALAFYKKNEDAYQDTDKNTELTGFLIKADNGNYYFTNAVEVPATFNMNAGIRKPTSWKIKDTLHTHPGGRGNQEGFSKTDAQAVLSGSTPGYYVRTPKGDVRFINKSIAKRTRQRWGAKGKSICSGGSSCMTPYGSSN